MLSEDKEWNKEWNPHSTTEKWYGDVSSDDSHEEFSHDDHGPDSSLDESDNEKFFTVTSGSTKNNSEEAESISPEITPLTLPMSKDDPDDVLEPDQGKGEFSLSPKEIFDKEVERHFRKAIEHAINKATEGSAKPKN